MSARPRTVHGIDLHAPGGIARLLAFRRQRHGDLMMTAPVTTETETTTTETKPVTETTTETTKTETEPKFTQADLDRIVGQRVTEERTKAQKALEDAQALAGKSETQRLELERDQAKQAATETTQKAAQRIARTEAKGIARDLDARPDRLDAILNQADLTAAIVDGEVDEAKLKPIIEKVLADYPEWKKTAGGPTQSGGELNGGGGGGKPTFTRKQLEEMPQEEMTRRIDEINEAIADGRVTG